MLHKPLSTIGLVMPEDFAVEPYEAIHSRVTTKKENHPDTWAEYAGAWNAVAYRFHASADHDEAYTESIQRAGDSPPQPERYIQEKELFGFFVTGLSAVESLCYGLFAIASMLNERCFLMTTTKHKKSIGFKKTTQQFAKAFPGEDVTYALRQMRDSKEFSEWREIRNILTHRSAPGRVVYLSTKSSSRPSLWKIGIQLDGGTTTSRRKWLAATISRLLKATGGFTDSRF